MTTTRKPIAPSETVPLGMEPTTKIARIALLVGGEWPRNRFYGLDRTLPDGRVIRLASTYNDNDEPIELYVFNNARNMLLVHDVKFSANVPHNVIATTIRAFIG